MATDHHHEGTFSHGVKKAIHVAKEMARAKIAVKALASELRKHGVSNAALIALVAGKKGGKKKIKAKHDGTFEVEDIDGHDETDIDGHDEDISLGMVRDEEDDLLS
jgi:hypothetical protein